MQIRTLADANVRYLLKMWPYSGKPTRTELAPLFTMFESVPELVKSTVREVAGTGRNVTMDRYFTSVPLIDELLADRVTVISTINRNRRFLPRS